MLAHCWLNWRNCQLKKTKALFPRYFIEPLELKPWKMQWRRSYNEAFFLPICAILSCLFIGGKGEWIPFNSLNLLKKLLQLLNICMIYDWITLAEFDNDNYLNKTNLLHLMYCKLDTRIQSLLALFRTYVFGRYLLNVIG